MSEHSTEKDAGGERCPEPCCTACEGRGGDQSGACSDCYGTGHVHPIVDEPQCRCGTYAQVFGETPDPGCPAHGKRGYNAWSACWACGKNVRHSVGHECEASDD